MLNTRLIEVLAPLAPKMEPGQWVEAGTPIGTSPDLMEEVRAPVSGVITHVHLSGELFEVVLERRREYEEMDD